MVLLVERDKHVRVGRSGSPGVVIDVVDVAVREANVVEDVVDFGRWNCLSNAGLYVIDDARGVLNAGSGLSAHMQDELSAIGVGKEVLAKIRNQGEGAEAEDHEARNEDLSRCNEAIQQRGIGESNVLEDSLESLLEAGERVA